MSPKLIEMVDSGQLGVKSGHGFYQYNKARKPIKTTPSSPVDPDVQQRLISRMLNEAVACLQEGVVSSAAFLDAGMIFGTGFAPFRGGPMHYIESKGVDNMVKQLQTLAARYGERFQPVEGWQLLANADNAGQARELEDGETLAAEAKG